jgi:methylated-DNA-[protein]-cysteine S-methyltransferase
MAHQSINTPVGLLSVFEDNQKIIALEWGRVPDGSANELTGLAIDQLRAYFDGRLKTFDLPLAPAGSPFQKAVCTEMTKIPYGQQWSYGELGKRLGKPAQAIGGACGRNPIPIIIPCHRVVAVNGTMTGFSGGQGIETKVWLLRHEGAIMT